MSPAKAPPVKAPTDRGSLALMIGTAAFMPLALFGGWTFGPVLFSFAALCGAFGYRQFVYGRAAVRTHAALQAITRGQMDEAELHLGAVPRRLMKRGVVMRSVLQQRALIAFYRGDAKSAVALLDQATSTRTSFATKNYEGMQRTHALALRALALASAGETTRARTDAAEVVGSDHATPEALARARLAEAVALARGSEHDALATFFRTHGSLVLEHSFPRERVLARALRKMVQTRSRSVYREAARPADETPDAGTIGEWIAQIAPDAAAHATEATRLAERAEIAPAAVADEAAVRAVKDSRERAAKGERGPRALAKRAWARTLALWCVLIAMFFAIYQLLTPSDATETTRHAHRAASSPPPMPLVDITLFVGMTAAVAIVAVFVVMLVKQTRKLRQTERDIVAAQRTLALGDLAAAEPLLVKLETKSMALGPANALYLRAKQAEQEARFEDCIGFCDRALGSIAGQLPANRMLASMILTPAVIGLRGVALATLGRANEATAELATIAREHATWSHRAAAELRIRLMLAVKSGDLEAARAVARERTPEMPVTLRDETLADLVLATAPSGASRDEQERVDAEIREDMTLRTWIDAVSPALRDDLARRVSAKDPGMRGDVRMRVEDTNPAEIQASESEEEEQNDEAAYRRA